MNRQTVFDAFFYERKSSELDKCMRSKDWVSEYFNKTS